MNYGKDDQEKEVPAGVYADIDTIKHLLEEIEHSKKQKKYNQAIDTLEWMLENLLLPPVILQQILLESVDLYLEVGSYGQAQEVLRDARAELDLAADKDQDISDRILYIGIVRELLNKYNQDEVPWSQLPEEIKIQADSELVKIRPAKAKMSIRKVVEEVNKKKQQNEKITTENITAQESGQHQSPGHAYANQTSTEEYSEEDDDEPIAKEKTFLLIGLAVALSIVAGFMLAMAYLSWQDARSFLNNDNQLPQQVANTPTNNEQEANNEDELLVDVEDLIKQLQGVDPSLDLSDIKPEDFETVDIQLIYAPGDWHIIQAGAYNEQAIWEGNVRKLNEAGFHTKVRTGGDFTQLIIFAGTSNGQADDMVEVFNATEGFEHFPAMVRSVPAREQKFVIEGKRLEEQTLSLLGERMTGYLRLLSETSLYILQEDEAEKNYNARRQLGNMSVEMAEQFKLVLVNDKNATHSILKKWETELVKFAQDLRSTDEAHQAHYLIQAHLFSLIESSIW